MEKRAIKMEYFEHKAVWTMFACNVQFYEETWQSGYDVFRFARKMLRGRWSGESIIRYLAFGFKHYPREEILETLDKECPNWKEEFEWQVLVWGVEGLL